MDGEKKRTLYTCGFCRKSWREKTSYLEHSRVCRRRGEDGSLPRARPWCPRCLKTFARARNFRNHRCIDEVSVRTCPFCEKGYRHETWFKKHVAICDGKRRREWLSSLNMEKKKAASAAPRRAGEAGRRRGGPSKVEYVCNKCGCRFKKLAVSKMAFH